MSAPLETQLEAPSPSPPIPTNPGLRNRLAGAPQPEDDTMRVKSSSDVRSVASAIAHSLYEGRPVTLRAIGASAIGQTMKAFAISAGYVAPRGIQFAIIPAFLDVKGNTGDTLTAMTFRVVQLG